MCLVCCNAKKRYLNKIRTSIKNEDVFYRLQQEIETRTNENSMKYMSNIISWINQCGWEKYEPLKTGQKITVNI